MDMHEELRRLGFVEPFREKRLFSIRHWSKNEVEDDYIFSLDGTVDNLEAARGTTAYVSARTSGSFLFKDGGQLIAPNLRKCNSIILMNGARAYCPRLEFTESGWFGEDDAFRNGMVFVDKGCLIYAPHARFRLKDGEGEFLRAIPGD